MIINIAIYENLKYYLECFPDKTEEDFEEYNSPFYQAIIASTISKEEETFRFCLINDKFKEFLKDNNLTDIQASLKTYINKLTDEEVEDLWKDSIPSRNTELMLCPFLLIEENLPQKTNFSLSQENIEKLKNNISKEMNINHNSIYIPGYIASFETLINYGDSLISLGDSYFYDNKIIKYKMFEEQINNEGYNMYLYAIPIFIKKDLNYKIDSSFLKNILEIQNPDYKLESSIIKEIINIDKTIVPLTDNLIYADDLPTIYEDICNLIEKESKQNKKSKFFDIFNFFKNKKE